MTDRDAADFAASWESWHTAHERVRADPHGFLAITSAHWLTPEPQRFDDVPGAWSAGADGAVVVLAEGEALAVDGVPDAAGRVRIDFNRATNLPCAYTSSAMCPLPPVENRLDVAIEAGEKIPG